MEPGPWCSPVHECSRVLPARPRWLAQCGDQARGRRSASYATSGGSRLAVNVDTSWNHCARSCRQSRRRRSPCAAHTTEDDPSQEPCFVATVHVACIPSTNRFTCCSFSLSVWSTCPDFDRAPLVHCASLAERVFFIAVHCASVAKGVFFYAGPFCNIRQCLLTHKHFPSVVVSGQHGGARRGCTLQFAEAAGSTTLCTVLDVTCSQPSFGHMARNV